MTALDEIQRLMVRAIRQRRALEKLPEFRSSAAEHFTGNDALSPVAQLEIYRQQFWLRHTSALVEDFPGVGGILGQRSWERLVEEYLEAHPPSTPSLRDLGAHLPEFVRLQARWIEPHALVSDMARLEWAYVEVFDAAELGPLRPERLAVFDEDAWSRARVVLAPSLRLLRVAYPVVELRKRLSARGDEPVLLPEPNPMALVVHRANWAVQAEPVGDVAFALLEALAQGSPLPEACELSCRFSTDPPESVSSNISEWFAAWVRRGWIADVSA